MGWLRTAPALPIRPWLVLIWCVSTGAPTAAEWEVAGYMGGAHTESSDLLLRQPSLVTHLRFGDIGYRGGSFETPLYYGARGGYFLRPRWAVEGEFVHLKVFAHVRQTAPITGTLRGSPLNVRQPVDTIVQSFSISHGLNLLLANVVFRQPLWRSRSGARRLNLAVRLGAGTTFPHPESIIEGSADAHYQTGSPAIQFAGGVELHLWRKLWWIGEYKFTRTRQEVDVFSGTATSLLRTHHAVTGPAIRF